MDPSKNWCENEAIIYGKLICELVIELPPVNDCAVTHVEIEEILKTAYKNQRSKYQKLADPTAKSLFLQCVCHNNRNLEVCTFIV